MYHLFNSVYVEFDLRLDNSKNRINISANTGFDFAKRDHDMFVGEQLGYGESLEAIGVAAFDSLMDKAIAYEDKLIIFVDSTTYIRLYAMLLKSLFPNIDFDTFKFLFICKKALLDGKRATSYRPSVNAVDQLLITSETVVAAFERDDEFLPCMKKIVKDKKASISLEWSLVKLIAAKDVGNIPSTLANIVKRTILSNAHETLGLLGYIITDKDNWEFLGCNETTLLNRESVYTACTNIGFITDSTFLNQSTLSMDLPKEWLVEFTKQLITVLERTNEHGTVIRSKSLLSFLESDNTLENSLDCLERVNAMFNNGESTIHLSFQDFGKYDENVIRFILKKPVSELKALMKGAKW